MAIYYTRALFGVLVIRLLGVLLGAGLRDLWPSGVRLPLTGVPGAGLPGPGLLERPPDGVLEPLCVGVVDLAEDAAVLRA